MGGFFTIWIGEILLSNAIHKIGYKLGPKQLIRIKVVSHGERILIPVFREYVRRRVIHDGELSPLINEALRGVLKMIVLDIEGNKPSMEIDSRHTLCSQLCS